MQNILLNVNKKRIRVYKNRISKTYTQNTENVK